MPRPMNKEPPVPVTGVDYIKAVVYRSGLNLLALTMVIAATAVLGSFPFVIQQLGPLLRHKGSSLNTINVSAIIVMCVFNLAVFTVSSNYHLEGCHV